MKTGIDLFTTERLKQIDKHGFTAKHHAEHPEWYENNQLQLAAFSLLSHEFYEQSEVDDTIPEGWDRDWFLDLHSRPHKERLIIAGTLIAAELDRLEYLGLEWKCTDPDTDQWGRQISWAGFEFKTGDSEPVVIDLIKYTKEQWLKYLSAYYPWPIEEIEKELGEDYAWILAECIYETDFEGK